MDINDDPIILLMYIGRCLLNDNKTVDFKYYQLDEDEFKTGIITKRDGHPIERMFSKAVYKQLTGTPGIVYRVIVPKENPREHIYASSGKFIGRWHDKQMQVTWQIADDAEKQRIALMKMTKKMVANNLVLERLDPIRVAYKQARGLQKDIILARVVQYITR